MCAANTYVEPTAGTSLNSSRGQYNNSLRAILSNFKSPARPVGGNILADGVNLGEVDGMLFRSETTNALYISDSANKKSTPIGGNFTRWGIGHRVEPSISVLTTNKTQYEIGELVATLDDGRLYIRTSNVNNISSFTEIGATQGYTLGTLDNVVFSGQSISAVTMLATSNVGINIASPTYELDVVGNARVSANVILGDYIKHQGDLNTYMGFQPGVEDTIIFGTANNDRLKIDFAGNVGVNIATAKSKFEVSGNAYISTQLTVGTTANIIGGLGVTGVANIAGGMTSIANVYARQNVVVSGNLVTSSLTFTGASNVWGVVNSANGVTSSSTSDSISADSYTPTYIGSNIRLLTNNNTNPVTFNSPTDAGNYNLIVRVTNGASAGTITMTGFDKVTGDAFTTTSGHVFFTYITKIGNYKLANIVAMQ